MLFPKTATDEERAMPWRKIAEDFAPVWVKLEDFIAEQEWSEGKKKNYTGSFANRRDLLIAQYCKG
jgi:hypothetical protein